MKKSILKYSVLTLAFVVTLVTFAHGQKEKKKFVEKSYKVRKDTRLRIENKFGKVEIKSWDKSEFSIRIEMTGRGRDERRAEKMLDAITIDIREGADEIGFETEIKSSNNKNDEGFEVDYTIFMPEINPLLIRNKFGDVTIGDRLGDLSLHVDYGSMRVGDVQGKSEIRLSFGSGSISDIAMGEFTVKYSKMDIESGTIMELEQGFSDIEIGTVATLELESKYGSVEIEKGGNIEADAHFSNFEIEELTGSLEMECSYLGDFTIGRLSKSFTLVDIEAKFGSHEINIEPGLNANIDAEFSFADLRISSDVNATFSYQVKESNRSTYRGKIGDGDPNKIIRIDSGYGNLRLRTD